MTLRDMCRRQIATQRRYQSRQSKSRESCRPRQSTPRHCSLRDREDSRSVRTMEQRSQREAEGSHRRSQQMLHVCILLLNSSLTVSLRVGVLCASVLKSKTSNWASSVSTQRRRERRDTEKTTFSAYLAKTT